MITVENRAALPASDQYALDLLIDLARLVATEDAADASCADAVRIAVDDHAPGHWEPARAPEGVFGIEPGRISVPRTVLASVVSIAAARGEQDATAHDRFGRVPSGQNELVRCAADRSAPVSALSVALRECVVRAAGRRLVALAEPWPEGCRWAAALTHDLDVVALWPVFTGLRIVELARRGHAGSLLRVLGAAMGSIGGSPVRRGTSQVLGSEAAFGARSSWFVLSGTPTWSTVRRGDLTYRPESKTATRILADVEGAGHELGLHGSFATFEQPDIFAAQRRRLEALVPAPVRGVRQHFLRFAFQESAHAMRAAGFTYDSSIGFADRNGFRLGVADILPLWDAGQGAPTGIDEAPFAWMDRALSKYRGVESPDAWVADALELAATCRAVEGVWIGIWHPNLTPALGFPGAPEAYRTLVQRLSEGQPFFAPLGTLVDWRRARRALRIRAVRPDGVIVVRGRSTDGRSSPGLESPDTTPLRSAVA
jgi:hypothetical protein